MLSKVLEDPSGSFMVEGKVIFGVNPHIIHVDFKPLLHNHVRADVVHEHLESGGCVGNHSIHILIFSYCYCDSRPITVMSRPGF